MSRFTFTEEKHAEVCRLLAERRRGSEKNGIGDEALTRPVSVN
jgi:hypothetical protein